MDELGVISGVNLRIRLVRQSKHPRCKHSARSHQRGRQQEFMGGVFIQKAGQVLTTPLKVRTVVVGFHLQFGPLSGALRDSDVFLSSLMTADRASGLMPCSQSLTHIDRDSMSKPVFRSLEISSSTSIVSRTAFRFALAALAIVMDENS